jgi:predicted O-methyltransferase YrrM
MKFSEIQGQLQSFELKTTVGVTNGKRLYDFVLANRPRRCLELGFGHGSSACYVAGALDELCEGKVTAVDLEPARSWQHPAIEELLAATGLGDRVEVVREATSYTWFLHRMVRDRSGPEGCEPVYDFCFVDGAKHWTIDGLAFFLVDKLLNDGGWIAFDDFGYTFRSMMDEGFGVVDYISLTRMSDEELDTPHIESLFNYLVMQHPSYGEFKIQDGWLAWAHEIDSRRRKLVIDESYTLGTQMLRQVQRVKRLLFGRSTAADK